MFTMILLMLRSRADLHKRLSKLMKKYRDSEALAKSFLPPIVNRWCSAVILYWIF